MTLEQNQLSDKILELVQSNENGVFLSVIFGIAKDFSSLKIRCHPYPEYFEAMRYAKSNSIDIKSITSLKSTRQDKIKLIGEVIREVSLKYKQSNQSNCIPYVLIVETEDSPEPFYETEIYPCGASGTEENSIDMAFIGIEQKSIRHELIIVGSKNIFAICIDNHDPDIIKAAGLEGDYQGAPFGHVTYFSDKNGLDFSLEGERFFIKKSDSLEGSWRLTKSYIWGF